MFFFPGYVAINYPAKKIVEVYILLKQQSNIPIFHVFRQGLTDFKLTYISGVPVDGL